MGGHPPEKIFAAYKFWWGEGYPLAPQNYRICVVFQKNGISSFFVRACFLRACRITDLQNLRGIPPKKFPASGSTKPQNLVDFEFSFSWLRNAKARFREGIGPFSLLIMSVA